MNAETTGNNRQRDNLRQERENSASGKATSSGLLKERAYTMLKKMILEEKFPPGTFLSERQLVEVLGGMSKTPIRVALERLETDGFVSVSPKQGILVRELSLHDITDIFDIRIALETFTVARLAGRLTVDQQRRLERNLTAAEACVHAGDEIGYAKLDAEFHLLLSEFLDNREITQTMQRNQDKLARVILRVLRRDKGRLSTSHADHVGVAQALFNGDQQLAVTRIHEHLEYGKRVLVL